MHVLIVQHIGNDFLQVRNIAFKVIQSASLNCDANQMSIVLLKSIPRCPVMTLSWICNTKEQNLSGIHMSILWLLVKAFL